MPDYSQQITEGEGKFKMRLVVEGWPYIFVDSPGLVRSLSDGREQILGLDPTTLRIAAQADLMRATLLDTEQSVELVDDDDHAITLAVGKSPEQRTYLQSELSESATTATVSSTDGFSSSGVLHLHTEAMSYSGKTATTFTGLTRGIWGTIAQKHHVEDGERRTFPRITELPRTLRGRRVWIYLYGEADSLTGDGTLVWRGIAQTDLSYQKGRWSFSVQPISWLLSQPVGSDVGDPVPIRGIYLPADGGALALDMQRLGGATAVSAPTSDVAPIRMSGFWETQDDFIAELATKIATAISGWTLGSGALLTAESLGTGGWRIFYRPDATTPVWVKVLAHEVPVNTSGTAKTSGLSPVDRFGGETEPEWFDVATGARPATLTGGAGYEIVVDAPVPRAVLGTSATARLRRSVFTDPTGPDHPPDRIYLGGNVVPSTSIYAIVRPEGEAPDREARPQRVIGADTANRYIRLAVPGWSFLGPRTAVKLARALATDAYVWEFIDTLATDSPGLVNAGAMPLISKGGSGSPLADFSDDYSEVQDAIADLRAAKRNWVASEGVGLAELLEEELKLLGCYMALDATGKIIFRRLRLAVATSDAAATFTSTELQGDFPAMSKNPDGHVGQVLIRQGYDFVEGEHRGLTIQVRNVETADATPLMGVLEIAPLSEATARGSLGLEIDIEDAYVIASAVFGAFGGGYRIVTAQATITNLGIVLGSTALLTTPHVPDDDGTMGLTTKEAVVIGYDWSPYEGRGSLTFLLHDLRIAGYSPGFLVSSWSGSGTVHTATVSMSDYTDSTDVADWFAVGDEVMVRERDSLTPTEAAGTITAIPATNQIEVTFDASFTAPSESTIGYDVAGAVDESAPSGRRWAQSDYAFVAGSTLRITLASGAVPAQDFAP